MDNYVYILNNKIYINLTNRCSNRCDFCIRQGREGMNGTPLWIKEEPAAEDVLEQLPQNLDDFDSEVVFCGFGEPTYNLETLEEVAAYLHCVDKTTRINTNGQANLIHKRDVTDVIADSCDVINVSLNECNAQKYQLHCNSIFGAAAFDELLNFAKLCKQRGANVVFSVVDSIGETDVAECKKLSDKLGIPMRVRTKE
ncbi:MAG: TatD family nuclease-associated radical SAM protein [Corallococcus sp.]|nr:TatD family nuclease-associated radical SAM protein [Corallococcus sp.]MCM1359642.1 TatD family nuclease-associated radical SAM protein [Corallococcus sp.]MCM1395234.1 TatD family nuclease-associated radical SAM protein [Corallococcus sp.]